MLRVESEERHSFREEGYRPTPLLIRPSPLQVRAIPKLMHNADRIPGGAPPAVAELRQSLVESCTTLTGRARDIARSQDESLKQEVRLVVWFASALW